MRYQAAVVAWGLGLLVLAWPASAHHSFAATYDRDKPVKLEGVVTTLHFRNPHFWIYFDVPGSNGVVAWRCEGVAPNQLYRLGWTKETLKPGDRITVEGSRAKVGGEVCDCGTVTLPDGRRVLAGQRSMPE